MKTRMIAFASAVLLLTALIPSRGLSQDNTLSAEEKKNGWILLFDGKTTNGWRSFKNQPVDSWEVVNGELHSKLQGAKHHEDLITKEMYGSFEIQLDWKIEKEANSGLLYHVLETKPAAYETGPEYQLIDERGYDGKKEKIENWQKSGADYAMHPPSQLASKPAGEYNHTRLVVNGAHVEHWLNGIKVVDFMAWTPEWDKLKATGKWKDYPDYGKAKSGYIDLQDHGGGVWFKNVKIRKL
jgi:hypothetical protein